LDDEQEQVLFDALQRKAQPEIKEYLDTLAIAADHRRMLTALVELNGDGGVLAEARQVLRAAGSAVQQALDNLEQIAGLAQRKMPDVALHFDLAELRGYHYQTGVVFAAFVPGHGQEIARGGRYDDIGRAFGGARPATGFSTDLETLIMLSPSQQQRTGAILAPDAEDPALHAAVAKLRGEGQRVCMALPGQSGTPQEMGCDRVLELRDGAWLVKTL
jgi:ATP phosphoribosyltransferase regulatory subunit